MTGKVTVYVIDPENQVVKTSEIEPTLDAVCSVVGCQKIRGMSRAGMTVLVPADTELDRHTYLIHGIDGFFYGNGVVTKLDEERNLIKSDLSLEQVRSLISFHLFPEGEELEHRRGLAWVKATPNGRQS